MNDRRRASVGAATIGALLVLAPLRQAAANDFTDTCNTSGTGMFQPKDCECLDGKITASGDRGALITYFKTMAALAKGEQKEITSEVSTQIEKANSLLPKYTGECVK
jgi:hypothetical protein